MESSTLTPRFYSLVEMTDLESILIPYVNNVHGTNNLSLALTCYCILSAILLPSYYFVRCSANIFSSLILPVSVSSKGNLIAHTFFLIFS